VVLVLVVGGNAVRQRAQRNAEGGEIGSRRGTRRYAEVRRLGERLTQRARRNAG
jgi:hypothetical protein